MKPRVHDPRRLDVARAAAEGIVLSDELPLAGMHRLLDEEGVGAPAESGRVVWSARFELHPVRGAAPEPRVRLQAQARVWRRCQRCLQPVAVDLAIDRTLRFAADEATAAALDADSEEDVLAMDRRLDLPALVEDELLLALPLVPRHEVCDQPLTSDASAAEAEASPAGDEVAHPFAALARLKPEGTA